MIKKFILWYLRRKSLSYCAYSCDCTKCPFGDENATCGVILITKAFEKID